MTVPLFTGSWSALYRADEAGQLDVQPVRISRGVPKFWPAAQAFPTVPDLMPDASMLKLPSYRFWPAFWEKLDRVGVESIERQLAELAAQYPRPLALACFEKSSIDCHRGPRGFAGWWSEKTGETTAEFEPRPTQLDLLS
jgi:hypothetical protein